MCVYMGESSKISKILNFLEILKYKKNLTNLQYEYKILINSSLNGQMTSLGVIDFQFQPMAGLQAPDKSVYWKIIFFISHPKHMLWVLKRTVSLRWFF